MLRIFGKASNAVDRYKKRRGGRIPQLQVRVPRLFVEKRIKIHVKMEPSSISVRLILMLAGLIYSLESTVFEPNTRNFKKKKQQNKQ